MHLMSKKIRLALAGLALACGGRVAETVAAGETPKTEASGTTPEADAQQPAIDSRNLASYFWGCGTLAIPALYAAVVDERVAGVFLEDAPDHHTSETALFRILCYADVPQSAAMLFPRPVFFSGTRAPGFAWTDEVYRLLGQRGRCTTSAESPAKTVAH
ncbi:MAG: hypothetical protein NTY19_19585 [Planctomycetota bacterium]|nr:hypothetical protein [Planctomycetota bacterium]